MFAIHGYNKIKNFSNLLNHNHPHMTNTMNTNRDVKDKIVNVRAYWFNSFKINIKFYVQIQKISH